MRAPSQQNARPYSTILGYLLVVLFAAVVSFWAGASWSQTLASSPASHAAGEIHKTILNGSNGTNASENVHIYFLLDRSGSMQSIASDVIKGFNAFVKEQQLSSPDDETGLTMTLIQFDSQNPHEVIFSGRDIASVPPLTSSTFQPRSMTPLFDALGRTIDMAESGHVANERIVVVTFSDGLENNSREYSRKNVFDKITTKRDAGWTFVFLGANQDSYAEAGLLGVGAANTQNFAFDGEGTALACQDVSTATRKMRSKLMKAESFDNEDFFEGSKSAELDYSTRSGDHID